MTSEFDEGIIKSFQYTRCTKVIEGLPSEVNKVQSDCLVHRFWWHRRIGETNIFECLHSDHQDRPAKGETFRVNPPSPR